MYLCVSKIKKCVKILRGLFFEQKLESYVQIHPKRSWIWQLTHFKTW